jgi:hypothetical protein
MAIRLMREAEVPSTPSDRVFRESRLRCVVFVLVCLGACLAMIISRWPGSIAAYCIGAVIVAFLLAGRRFITGPFRPSNWLVRATGDGLFLHFRYYLNDHLSPDDPTVAFVPYQDIRSARLVRERVKTLDSDGTTHTVIRYVEFELASDPALLAAALVAESARHEVPEKRWYGSSTTLYRHYPVRMQSPPFLRIQWHALPGASTFLDGLPSRVEIAPAVRVSEDFADLERLTSEEQKQRLRELNQRGQTIAAVYLARKLYGLDLTAATKLVKALSGESQS